MSSEDNSEDMRGVPSSGRESYVFQANKPQGLLGVHADLVEKALRPEEGLLYLLYSPIYPERKGPFGLYATPASHAVAVTKHRFIISENRHTEGITPTVQSISFDQVLYVELGNALILGWFSIEFVADDKPSCTTFFFPATTGMKHFGILVRKYRSTTCRSWQQLPVDDAMDWTDIWQHTPRTEVDHLMPLILKEEFPLSMLRSSELWIYRKRRWKSIPVCLSINGIFVLTSAGFIYAKEEAPVSPNVLSFGVNISCIAFDALKSARLHEKRLYGRLLTFLQLEIAREQVSVDFDIPFAGNSLKEAGDHLSFMIFKIKP
jgi:hypothetical protein